MPDGDIEKPGLVQTSGKNLTITAIDAKAAVGDGVWLDTLGMTKKSALTEGLQTGDIVTITEYTSPLAKKPANTIHGHVIDTLTIDGLTVWESPSRWVKIRISTWVSGTISAYLSTSA